MKKLLIDGTTRKISKDKVVVGYLQENKVEKLEFEIPEEYKTYGRKACFKAQDKTFAKIFDDITGNTLTLTRDMTQYDELEMSIAFFKTENEDEIVARTSILKIYIENAIICDDDIQPDEPKLIILDELIQKVTKLNEQVTKDEEIRQNQEAIRQQNEATREENEQVRVFDELGRKKAEEERKNNELERISNENERKTNEEQRKANENKRVSNENAREEYINNLKTQVDNGDFDGADFNYKWDGTKLGVKNSKETTYQFVELKGQKGDKGEKGDKGDTGNGIQNIEKVSTVENVDTYAINYTDGTQTTFDVTNGEVTKEQLDEVDNRAKKTRNELERVKNDILETGTASDSFINVQDSAWAELQALSVDGVLKQNTTQGNNLLNINNLENKTINGVSLTKNDDGTITLNGTATADANFRFAIDDIEATTNYAIQLYKFQGNFTNNYVSIYLSEDSQFSTFHLLSLTSQNFVFSNLENKTYKYAQIKVNSGVICNNLNIGCQIVKDKDIKTFEKFTGGEPSPNPNYPQKIETITGSLKLTSCGKNLLTNQYQKNSTIKVNGVSFKINDDNSITVNGTATENAIIYPIPVENAFTLFPGTYTLSGCPARGGSTTYKQDILTLNNAVIITDYGNQIYSSVLKANTTLRTSRIVIYKGFTANNLVFKPMLEISSVPSVYEEHIESLIEVNLPSDEFIGKLDETYKDELVAVFNQEEGQYHLMLNKMIRHLRLPISEMNNTDKYPGWKGQIIQQLDSDFPLVDNALSEYTDYISTATNKKNTYRVNSRSLGRPILYISSVNMFGSNITQTEIKEKYSDLIIDLYYRIPQNNQYTIDLGPIDIPLSYNETTNIFTDSDLLPQINAKYYRNFTKTVQNLQVNEKALKQELIDINNRLTALETAKASESEVNNDIPVE